MTTFRAIGLPGDAAALGKLFREVFTASATAAEGAVIESLVRTLMAETPADELRGYAAEEDGRLVGGIVFSRLKTERGGPAVLLSPVAVATDRQGRGLGRGLIEHGLRELQRVGVRLAVTYGDPAFYGRVGFHPVSTAQLTPPFALSQPEGWLAQVLPGRPVTEVLGRCTCVAAFDDPGLW